MQTLFQPTSRGLSPETISRRVLDNGLTVLVYPNPTIPSLVARLSVKGGAMYDPADKAGLASFAVRAMRRGTEKHPFDQLNEETEGRGASVGVEAGKALMEVGGRALKEERWRSSGSQSSGRSVTLTAKSRMALRRSSRPALL